MKARFILPVVFFILVVLAVAGPIMTAPVNSASVNKETGKANYSVLGLVVGESTGYEVHSKFGFALAFADDNDPEARQMCLVSDRDETLLRLRIKHNLLTGLHLQSRKKYFNRWHFCTKSILVSKYTVTDGGIRLGMSKPDLKSILGLPEEESKSRMKYIWRKSPNKTDSQSYQQIEFRADFYDGKLVSINVAWKKN